MSQDIRISQLTELTNPQGNEWAVVDNVNSLDVDGFPKTQKVRFNVIPEVEPIIYVNLKDLADGTNIGGQNPTLNRLVSGKWYLITDATTANIPLMVQATSASTIGTDAKSPDYYQDLIIYDFENDIILERGDPITNIYVCQDLRNLVNLTIGSGCTNISLGKDVTGNIGNDCSNVTVGNGSILSIGGSSMQINIGSNVSFTCGDGCERIDVLDGSVVVCFENVVAVSVGSNCDVIRFDPGCSNISIGNGCNEITCIDNTNKCRVGNGCSTITLGEDSTGVIIHEGISGFSTVNNPLIAFDNGTTYQLFKSNTSGNLIIQYYNNDVLTSTVAL